MRRSQTFDLREYAGVPSLLWGCKTPIAVACKRRERPDVNAECETAQDSIAMVHYGRHVSLCLGIPIICSGSQASKSRYDIMERKRVHKCPITKSAMCLRVLLWGNLCPQGVHSEVPIPC